MSGCRSDLLLKDEVYAIVGAALDVSNELGCGFLEAVYQEALEIEFRSRKIEYERQRQLKIYYKGSVLQKRYVADYFCYRKIIVEIKAVNQTTSSDDAQLLNYLKVTGCPLGILINFGTVKLEWKRYANTISKRTSV